MTTPTLRAAATAINARKTAAGGTIAGNRIDARPILIGFDVDTAELEHLLGQFAPWALGRVMAGIPLIDVLAGAWTDGFATGLMLAELREQARHG